MLAVVFSACYSRFFPSCPLHSLLCIPSCSSALFSSRLVLLSCGRFSPPTPLDQPLRTSSPERLVFPSPSPPPISRRSFLALLDLIPSLPGHAAGSSSPPSSSFLPSLLVLRLPERWSRSPGSEPPLRGVQNHHHHHHHHRCSNNHLSTSSARAFLVVLVVCYTYGSER